jgi:peroxiredoxin
MTRQLRTAWLAPAIVCLCCGLADRPLRAEAQPSPLGKTVESFTLNDFRGAAHSLDDYRGRKLVVVAFLGTECPLARLYGPRLAELDRKYAERGVTFLGVSSNVQDSITELAAYARRSGIEFPILKDLGNPLADKLGAGRTPEVFVLDAERVVRYHGRIDDQWGVGYVREKPTRRDLAEALGQLLAGRPVTVAETVGGPELSARQDCTSPGVRRAAKIV